MSFEGAHTASQRVPLPRAVAPPKGKRGRKARWENSPLAIAEVSARMIELLEGALKQGTIAGRNTALRAWVEFSDISQDTRPEMLLAPRDMNEGDLVAYMHN